MKITKILGASLLLAVGANALALNLVPITLIVANKGTAKASDLQVTFTLAKQNGNFNLNTDGPQSLTAAYNEVASNSSALVLIGPANMELNGAVQATFTATFNGETISSKEPMLIDVTGTIFSSNYQYVYGEHSACEIASGRTDYGSDSPSGITVFCYKAS